MGCGGCVRSARSPWFIATVGAMGWSGESGNTRGEGEGSGQEESARGKYTEFQWTSCGPGALLAGRAHRRTWLIDAYDAGGGYCTRSTVGARHAGQEQALQNVCRRGRMACRGSEKKPACALGRFTRRTDRCGGRIRGGQSSQRGNGRAGQTSPGWTAALRCSFARLFCATQSGA